MNANEDEQNLNLFATGRSDCETACAACGFADQAEERRQVAALQRSCYANGMSAFWPKRRWFQYSLRTLLIMVTLSGFGCSWLAVKMQQARREHEVAAAVQKTVAAGSSVVRWGPSPAPQWLRRLLGNEVFEHVDEVMLIGHVGDAQFASFEEFKQVRAIAMATDGNVTDQGITHLDGLSQLRTLIIDGNTHVTDAGLGRLAKLPQLEQLDLMSDAITDAGLDNLRGQNHLKKAWILGPRITDAGLKRLEQALPNCRIDR
jgi:hypothetical protein